MNKNSSTRESLQFPFGQGNISSDALCALNYVPVFFNAGQPAPSSIPIPRDFSQHDRIHREMGRDRNPTQTPTVFQMEVHDLLNDAHRNFIAIEQFTIFFIDASFQR